MNASFSAMGTWLRWQETHLCRETLPQSTFVQVGQKVLTKNVTIFLGCS